MSSNPKIVETHKRSVTYHYSGKDLQQLLIERVAKLNGFTLGAGTQGQVRYEAETEGSPEYNTGRVIATVMIEQDLLYVAPAVTEPPRAQHQAAEPETRP